MESFELTLPQGPHHALAAPYGLCWRTVTETKRVTLRRHGHAVKRHGHVVRRLEKIHHKVRRKLTMPTTIIAQNGAAIKHNTTIHVSGCGPKKAKKPAGSRHKPSGKANGHH